MIGKHTIRPAYSLLLQRGTGTQQGAAASEEARHRQQLASALCDASADCVRMRDFARDISNMFDYNWCAAVTPLLRFFSTTVTLCYIRATLL